MIQLSEQRPHIRLEWRPYEEFIWDISLAATNGSFSGAQVFYADPQDLARFGRELASFPSQAYRETRFELGSPEGNWAYFVLIRAYLYNPVGHAAIEISIDNREPDERAAKTTFQILCEVAGLNRLGDGLLQWVTNPREPFIWSPTW